MNVGTVDVVLLMNVAVAVASYFIAHIGDGSVAVLADHSCWRGRCELGKRVLGNSTRNTSIRTSISISSSSSSSV